MSGETAVKLQAVRKGRREIAFRSLPAGLSPEELIALARTWARQELVSHGMVCEARIARDGDGRSYPEFWCTTRRLDPSDPSGFGEHMEEWGEAEFMRQLHESFMAAVDDALLRKRS